MAKSKTLLPTPELDPAQRASILRAWTEFYEGSSTEPDYELEEYETRVRTLSEKGGSVYRVIFANSLDDIASADYGIHWTNDRHHIDMYIDSLWMHYGKDKQQAFVIEAVLPPGAVSIDGVDLAGNPHEKEVNIDPDKVLHYRHYLYGAKQLIPIESPTLAQLAEPVRSTHIEIDGIRRPARRSDGMPIAATLEDTIAFWREFGDSKVVDSLGRPIVVFHGTNVDFEEFTPSERGSFGSGIYFGDAEAADSFTKFDDGARLIPAFLTLKNPLVAIADYDIGESDDWDFDSAAIPLLQTLFGDKARDIVDEARDTSTHFGDEIQCAIEKMGHDGLILRYPYKSGDSFEYVAFSSSQVVSSINPRAVFTNSASRPYADFGAAKKDEPLPDVIEVDGTIRPTLNSKGAPIHPTESGMVNFWRWFGDSKSVDTSGRPVQLFHGTTAEFSAFDKGAVGNNFGLDKDGFFFTNNPVTAAHFADPEAAFVAAGMQPHRDVKEGAKILPVYVALNNPLTIDEYMWAYDTTAAYELDRNGISAIDYFDDNRASVMEMAKRYGRDGVIFDHANTSLYVALEPTQIKSSMGNTGAFNDNQPRIFNQPNYNIDPIPQAAADSARTLSAEEFAQKHEELEARVDAAFEAGDIELAEELDAELAAFRELEPGDIDNDEYEHFSLDDALSLTYAQVFAPAGAGVFMDQESAVANMRENIRMYGGSGMQPDVSDEQIIEAAREAYERKLTRIQAIRSNPTEFAYPAPPNPAIADTINVDGIMRPTQNSEDQLIHPTKAGIRNFWRWFGNSEAVDQDGRPTVYRHGSTRAPDGIEVFDTTPPTELGAHFGTPDQAGQFVWDDKGVVIPVYLKTDNLLRLSDLGDFTIEAVEPQLDELNLPQPVGDGLMEGDYLRARIQQAGYDGVIYLNRREGAHDPFGPDGVDGDELNAMTDDDVREFFPDAEDSIVVFDPSQIKSALGNSGTFSPQNSTILHQPAYHGTPHLFSEFSLKHIGNGEGNQSFGWGLYFAGSKEVAEHYRRALTVEELYVDGELLDIYKPLHFLARSLSDASGNEEEARDYLGLMESRGGSNSIKSAAREALMLLDAGSRPQVENRKPEGQLYTVDIPEDDSFLLWDKPWTEQPEVIQSALSKLQFGDYFQSWMRDPDVTGRDIYESVGAAILPRSGKRVWQEPASRHLAALGISGIKYLDGMSRQDGEGSFNYVVFDDSAIRTLERNGQPITKPYPEKLHQPAYHGTPHEFTKFSLDHVGKGEGVAAYGHGIYFTDTQAVADSYRRTLSRGAPVVMMNGRRLVGTVLNTAVYSLAEKLDAITQEDVRRYLVDGIASAQASLEPYAKALVKELRAGLKRLDASKSFMVNLGPEHGNLIKAEIPDEGYLMWDLPLIEQPQPVLAALAKSRRTDIKTMLASASSPTSTGDLPDGSHLYSVLSLNLSGSRVCKEASQYLLNLGIVGIKYLDGMSRDQTEGGSYNYVVFDDGSIRVTERNGAQVDGAGARIPAMHHPVHEGSSYVFAQHSLNHIGRGEQAMPFGWGVYFNDSTAIQEFYDLNLSTAAVWDAATASMIADRFAKDYPEALEHAGTTAKDLSASNATLSTAINNWGSPEFIQWASDLSSLATAPPPPIPDTSEFLLWDEPLHVQPAIIKNAARVLAIDDPVVTGRDIYAKVGQTPEEASKCLAAMGVEGIRYENPVGGFVVFTPPLIEALEDVNASLMSPSAANAAQVTMTRVPGGAEYLVELFKDANESSFLHEQGHIFLDVYDAASMQPGCSKIIKQDMAILREWMGIPAGAPITEEGHEKFARATEHYARTAEPPTPALKGVFDRFKGWLGRIHDRLKGRADFSMSDEVKGVLDRMFGADMKQEQIDAATIALPGERLAEEASKATPDATRGMHESHAAVGALVDQFLKVFSSRGLAEECMAEQILIEVAHKPPTQPGHISDETIVTDDLLEVDVDGVTRPTRNSLDQPIHSEVRGIRNFWRWFGNSAICDEAGRPRPMFHGSINKGVSEFDVDIEPVRGRTGPNGVYFTSSPDVASGYTRRMGVRGQRGEIIAAYLKIEEPLHTTAAIKKLQKKGVTFADSKAAALSALDTLKHDGVVFSGNSYNHDEYIVLNSWQIKSANKNSGEFVAQDKNIYFQPAYHGSPYKFDSFCDSHIGKGEGAQAYGFGLYFAQNPEVADWYRKQLSITKLVLKESLTNQYPGKQEREIVQTINSVFTGSLEARGISSSSFRPFSNLRDFYNAAHDQYIKKKDERYYQENKTSVDEKIASFNEKYDSSEEYRALVHEISGMEEKPDYNHFKQPYWSSYKGALDVLDVWLTKRGLTGAAYKVDLPSDDVMLHWDKSLSQQPPKVITAINSLHKELRARATSPNIVGEEPTGAAIYTAIKEYFSEGKNDVFTNHANYGAKEASLELADLGVKGIKYLDGLSRNAGEGGYNYVVFDASDVSIVQSHNTAKKLQQSESITSVQPSIGSNFKERLSVVSALAEKNHLSKQATLTMQ